MLALSLHNIGIVDIETCCSLSSEDDEECTSVVEEETDESPSHLSITLPCRMFRDSSIVTPLL